LSLEKPLEADIEVPAAGIKGKATVAIYENQVIVDLTIDNAADQEALRDIVADLVSLIVNGASLKLGVGYEVEIRTFYDVDQRDPAVFGADVKGFSLVQTGQTARVDLLSLFTVGGKEPLFRRAIADFKSAIRVPADTGFYCYRAVESLINHVKKTSGISDKKAAISSLESSLKLDSACIQLLRELGGDVRHGHVSTITAQERVQALRITQEILERFFDHQNSGKTAFPTLSP
jgi:hypothetical protein